MTDALNFEAQDGNDSVISVLTLDELMDELIADEEDDGSGRQLDLDRASAASAMAAAKARFSGERGLPLPRAFAHVAGPDKKPKKRWTKPEPTKPQPTPPTFPTRGSATGTGAL